MKAERIQDPALIEAAKEVHETQDAARRHERAKKKLRGTFRELAEKGRFKVRLGDVVVNLSWQERGVLELPDALRARHTRADPHAAVLTEYSLQPVRRRKPKS